MRCLALDIGGTKIAAAIVKNGEIEQRQQIHTPHENVVEGMHQALAKLLADYAGQFDYVAVASTGIINNGVLTALNPKNLGGLAEFPLKASIAKHTDKPIGLLMMLRQQLTQNINCRILNKCRTSHLLPFQQVLAEALC